MPREILMHLRVLVPPEDERSTPEIVEAVDAKLNAITVRQASKAQKEIHGLTLEVVVAEDEPEEEPVTHYTVHPFDDEWTWSNKFTSPRTSGSHPWTTRSLSEAIDHANLVRLEYASIEGADPEWLAGFWSAIYGEGEDSDMIGYVGPDGSFTFGSDPPVDENFGWKGGGDGD